jgi:hypothetical protein
VYAPRDQRLLELGLALEVSYEAVPGANPEKQPNAFAGLALLRGVIAMMSPAVVNFFTGKFNAEWIIAPFFLALPIWLRGMALLESAGKRINESEGSLPGRTWSRPGWGLAGPPPPSGS